MSLHTKKFPASLQRLPFHGIMEEPWEVLKPELSEDTIPRLLPLTIPLDMHPDKFHVTVIDNLISQQVWRTFPLAGCGEGEEFYYFDFFVKKKS